MKLNVNVHYQWMYIDLTTDMLPISYQLNEAF